MASTFDYPPATLHDNNSSPPTNHHFLSSNQQHPPTSDGLSPDLSQVEVDSDPLSPTHYLETPAGSSSSLSHYQASDFSDLDDYHGIDFGNAEGGTPSFIDDSIISPNQIILDDLDLSHDEQNSTYPLTPEHTASTYANTPHTDYSTAFRRSDPDVLPKSISPRELQKPFNPTPIVAQTDQFTLSQSSSCRSSEDSLNPSAAAMACRSPRVTVSMWGKDDETLIHTVERNFEDSPTTVRGGFQTAGDLISSTGHSAPEPIQRDVMGRWQDNPSTGHAGVDPDSRSSDQIRSINEIANQRQADESIGAVGAWLTHKMDELSFTPEQTSDKTIEELNRPRDDGDDNIPFGRETENQFKSGHTYYTGNGQMTQEDYDIIASDRNWADAPTVHPITRGVPGRHQPESSQAAIERFERMCRDTDSILSRAATWGTRRRSFSVLDLKLEDGTGTGILKKLSISRGDKGNRPGNLLRNLGGLVRRPSASQLLKRNRSIKDEESLPGSEGRGSQDSKRDSLSKRDSAPHLSPSARMSSWGKNSKTPMPSINTAIVSMGSNIASIGTSHARSGSISGSVTSPKSPFSGLTVRNSIRRPRSKSDLPKPSIPTPTVKTESHPTLVSMWKETGGPPVPALAKPASTELDDDDDDDDDLGEDSDLKTNANIIDGVNPNFDGFHQHVLDLNPDLAAFNTYLADRIAHQQTSRYKLLLKAKIQHLGLGASCPSGKFCLALGGSATVLESNNDSREIDPLSSPGDEDDSSPTEGAITGESFPADIPVPPTQRLPAEFECQLCYQSKKFKKPSDWTKHVHEDVQPFTCTWDKCREPKMFKRKADWVRHENEGHRHLEWWTCDVEACHHQCYRRDNFLQHLVREHRFIEPKVKTKAAMKKSGGADPTWQKVEQCHRETTKSPQEEPCRFCGRTFPTWKKLTVHLAKHMEQISLPVLRLVEAKAGELQADTIISPVHDPPVRHFPPPFDETITTMHFPGEMQQLQQQQVTPHTQQVPFHNQGQMMYPVMPTEQYPPQTFYQGQFSDVGQSISSAHTQMGLHPMSQDFNHGGQMQDLPVTTAAYMQGQNSYMAMPNNGMNAFAQTNALGLQNHRMSMGQVQVGYEGMMNPSSGHGTPFSGQESTSPYSRSPNLHTNNKFQ